MIDKAYIEKILARMAEVETELSQPDTASDQRRFRELVKEHARLKKLEQFADDYFSLKEEVAGNRELIADATADSELREMAEEELQELESSFTRAESALRVVLLPPDPNDDRNAIIEIRAGTGGDEAALFAGDLFRMYSRYAEAHGWNINIMDSSSCEVGGYKEVVFAVEGKGVYGILRFESGGHRVQRVPVTESQGRIHTSAATVAVFPEVEEEDELDIPAEELRVDIYCASGPGGQGVNTTYSAVRITHLPTGLVAQSQDERSQHRNKEKALKVLKARILDQRQRDEAERMGSARRTLIGSGDRSQRVRTYNFPQNRLSDHRINLTLHSLDRVIEGDMQELLTALIEHDVDERLSVELKKQTSGAGNR